MVRKSKDMRIAHGTDFHGGKGTVKMINFLEESESKGIGRLFCHCIIPAGASIGYHQHKGDNEIYYFLKGQGRVNDNGVEYDVEPGDSMMCYDGDYHSVENTGDKDLEFIGVILYSK